MHTTIARRLILCALTFMAAACAGGDDDDDDATSTGPVSYVVINPDSLTLAVGGTGQLTAQAFDSSGQAIRNARVRWRSVYPEVTVDSLTGRVRALGYQRASIEARVDTVVAYALVKVPGALAQIDIYPSIDSVVPGSTVQFTAQFWDMNMNPLAPSPLAWSVNNPTLGSVSGTGLFAARWPGVARVTATSGTFTAGADTRVLVPVASIELDPAELTLAPASLYRTTARLRDSAGNQIMGRTVNWSSTSGTTVDAAPTIFGLQVAVVNVAASQGISTVVASVEGHADTTRLTSRRFTFSRVTAGASSTCALDDAAHIVCWGANDAGKLGIAGVEAVYGPVLMPSSQSWTSVTTGWRHTCALTTTGQAWCWGDNTSGQLGDGSTTSSVVPVPVGGGYGFLSISAGNEFTCGITTGGETRCWGSNSYGQLGNGASGGYVGQPGLVSGAHAFVSIAAGPEDACGLVADGTAWCWGNPTDGALGVGMQGDVHNPQVIAGFQFESIAPASFHGCAIDLDGDPYCWGRADYTFTNVGESNSPNPLSHYTVPFTTIDAGGAHVCALNAEGQVLCWGANFNGEAGADRLTPVLTNAVSVSAGGGHSCGISAGRVFCWGAGAFGQLGVTPAALTDGLSRTPLLVIGQN